MSLAIRWNRGIARAMLATYVAGVVGCVAQKSTSSDGTKRMADTLASL